ncbi:hypothetical protein Q31b_55960 [Novipirellula aureliae]|uniref:Uncharacterized protein n=1 Tax=Novipirellula aureliae TaxID=2527966 RepID=A0A5C6DD02_9BACT|nr:hypothetical protein Q31b_55960 [Novipirellula aureliae]
MAPIRKPGYFGKKSNRSRSLPPPGGVPRQCRGESPAHALPSVRFRGKCLTKRNHGREDAFEKVVFLSGNALFSPPCVSARPAAFKSFRSMLLCESFLFFQPLGRRGSPAARVPRRKVGDEWMSLEGNIGDQCRRLLNTLTIERVEPHNADVIMRTSEHRLYVGFRLHGIAFLLCTKTCSDICSALWSHTKCSVWLNCSETTPK